jgi:hypothetical protein
VDDILIIYDDKNTNIDQTLNEFNNMQPTLHFTIEKEKHKTLNFLDLTIHRNKKQLQYAIYRKPTCTDIIIPNSSCHPYEHKISSINYLVNRMNTYPIRTEAKNKEKSTIERIIQNNGYNTDIISEKVKQQKQNLEVDTDNLKTKWVTFTYNGKNTKKITKLFKDTKLKIAYRTQNTIQNILKPQSTIEKYNNSGIYLMKCNECPLKYIGQTGRNFNTRYKEHIYSIKSNNSSIGYAKHVLDAGHSYNTIEKTMEIIKTGRKGKHLNTLERYYIHKVKKTGALMNEINTDEHNPIFETLHKINNTTTPHGV